MSEFDRVKAEAIAGPHYDGIPEHAKVGGVWGAMRTAAKEAYMAGAAERARDIATWMKGLAATARGHRDRMAHIPASWQSFDDWANRLEVLAEEMESEFAAFPQPRSGE